ncbi:hypothetical protein KUCAC02_004997, partial [Chaenocephalus aceratus]
PVSAVNRLAERQLAPKTKQHGPKRSAVWPTGRDPLGFQGLRLSDGAELANRGLRVLPGPLQRGWVLFSLSGEKHSNERNYYTITFAERWERADKEFSLIGQTSLIEDVA